MNTVSVVEAAEGFTLENELGSQLFLTHHEAEAMLRVLYNSLHDSKTRPHCRSCEQHGTPWHGPVIEGVEQ